MPPRLLQSVLRAPLSSSLPFTQLPSSPSLARALSSTPALAIAPAQYPSPPRRDPSSNSKLLSIDADGRRNPPRYRPQGSSRYSEGASFISKSSQSQLRASIQNLETLRNNKESGEFLREMPRRWEAGDVYAPHDLSAAEMRKLRKRASRKADVVDALQVRAKDMYKNFALLQEFTNAAGQILPSSATGLRPVNQRKIAKMVRRAQGMGIYPTVHEHPELIRYNFFDRQGAKEANKESVADVFK
ncbi:hypothetical protein E4U57_003382 [Claviceps arundinis]|uniref:Small ribosomal subunit protein bS18m n=1 Tax=Claviceps arundinis TaxID=1623583 RepID=A0A9P7MUW2_9HYPO|nr:hypothetical protein E4U57_003382 [Claviceps arundinis]KAG5970681.1 hypothetical protein E4U56_007468 [Claviceps arundinis]